MNRFAATMLLVGWSAGVGAQQQGADPASPLPAPAVPAQTTPASPAPAGRTFSAPVGLLFNTVRADRVADFEKVVGYLEAALAKTTDQTIRAQAKGWRVLRATEPGPNGSVLFVFVLDPVVPDADYGLGRILADGYPDPTQLQEIWKLYTGAVTSGGTLLNLSPVAAAPTAPTQTPAAPATLPLQADPAAGAPAGEPLPRMLPPSREDVPRDGAAPAQP